MTACSGVLVWHDVQPNQVVLECSACDYVHVGSGVPLDVRHAGCETIRAVAPGAEDGET